MDFGNLSLSLSVATWYSWLPTHPWINPPCLVASSQRSQTDVTYLLFSSSCSVEIIILCYNCMFLTQTYTYVHSRQSSAFSASRTMYWTTTQAYTILRWPRWEVLLVIVNSLWPVKPPILGGSPCRRELFPLLLLVYFFLSSFHFQHFFQPVSPRHHVHLLTFFIPPII